VTRRRWLATLTALALLPAAGALGYLGVFPGLRGPYANATPALAVAYRAKDGCTCLFVLRRSLEACRAWTRTDPDVASFEPDLAAAVVRSRALLAFSASARWLGPAEGCRLEP
jgi:hypothetical protein